MIIEMSETRARQPCLPAGRDKSMPTSKTIAFRLHSAAYDGWVDYPSISIYPMFPTDAMQCLAHDVPAAAATTYVHTYYQ